MLAVVVLLLPRVSQEQGVEVLEVVVSEVAALEAVLEAVAMGLVGAVEVPKLGMEVPSEDKVSSRSLLNVFNCCMFVHSNTEEI